MSVTSQSVRIIGGAFRGRRLRFPKGTTVRPTPDRVRETVFNWLAPYLPGARVLDAFAGSGALGIEALSRGAAEVVLLDRDARCVTAIAEHLQAWQVEPTRYHVQGADSIEWLSRGPTSGRSGDARGPFDIVFLDPPFDRDLWSAAIRALEQGANFAPQALVYLETPSAAPAVLASLDTTRWESLRSRVAGEVGYHLYRHAQVNQSNHAGEAGS
ncbi:MAG: 16S rRNA (guanine(966)-N(2))-methyltransferase RsmD [Gammaproteobacteria bacterium]|nr:16S rRNA (guanine(966)-N(2))-methyltransferase RsmD [Gammaproteobacteria bacterium]